VRLGLRYAKGLREEAARALACARERLPFTSIDDLALRVPELRKNELVLLAEIGALNNIGSPRRHGGTEKNECRAGERVSPQQFATEEITNYKLQISNPSMSPCLHGELKLHRRDALWQVERAVRKSGPLLERVATTDAPSPLEPMNDEERLVADFRGTGLTVGPHPMAYRRSKMERMGVCRAADLPHIPNGKRARIAGFVIARQRPGSDSGFVFLSLEDETGIANAIINPALFEQNRLMLVAEKFLMVEGVLQNQDNVISVKADRVLPLRVSEAETASHDFH
jgi:error-prone DNA polymerase